jgi:hypothetical protein
MLTKGNIVILLSLFFWPLVANAEISALTDTELAEVRGNCNCYWETDLCPEGELYQADCIETGGVCQAPGATCDEVIVDGPDFNLGCGPYGNYGDVCYPTKDGFCTEVAIYICVQHVVTCECDDSYDRQYRGTRFICTGVPCS